MYQLSFSTGRTVQTLGANQEGQLVSCGSLIFY
uniref:Uncharacterized protein n=1 Tax=Anguilla anguilla TaxID=7936 RepID=A0A0E9UYM7_ANGAN